MNRVSSVDSSVAIIGSGPYGLSLAAHLRHRGVPCRVIGKAMHTWSAHMPAKMRLKSEGFASTLFDPLSRFTLAKYCADHSIPYADVGLPVEIETFIEYGLAFQRTFVPDLQSTLITSVQRNNGSFSLQCQDGSQFLAGKVIIATGISHLEHMPSVLRSLGPRFATHSADHVKFEKFAGRDVAVIGAGASATDVAAALIAEGANVQLITRQSVVHFHSRQSRAPRPWMDRLRAPMTGLGPGWRSLLCVECPLVFHQMPSGFRAKVVRKHLGPAGGWFVRDQVVGKAVFHLRSNVTSATIRCDRVSLSIDGGSGKKSLDFDHVIAATGYRPNMEKLQFIDPDLRTRIKTVDGYPILSTNFESSVEGLYFIGPPAAGSFGPLMRFAYGARYAARRVTRHLA